MSSYLMTLTPQEPYFFGNEKSFKYPGTDVGNESNRYYIRSENIPTQTTVFGTLRYVLLPVKKKFGEYNASDVEANAQAVGEKSFKYGENRRFGKIKSLSPIFIVNDNGEIIIKTPLDHKKGEKKYTPFSFESFDGGAIYPTDYNAKKGLSYSYMNVDTCRVYDDDDSLFKSELRVGINRLPEDKEKGFFKKDYTVLKEGFSFAAYVTLDDGILPENTVVFMGQGKSLFTVQFQKVDDGAYKALEEKIRSKLSENITYCFSDIFIKSDIYKNADFSITATRDYRAYINKSGRISKDSTLYRLISAGSVFVSDRPDFKDCFDDPSVEIIGYNKVISKNGGIK